jgi:hypothetical protein
MMEMKRSAIETGAYGHGGAIASMYQLAIPSLRYLAWTLGTGNETSARIFDELLDEATELLVEAKATMLSGEIHGEPRKQAAVLVAMQFAALVFHDHLTRAFGVDMLTAEGLLAAAPYSLQVFSGDLFDKEVITETKKALAQLEQNREATS